MEKLGLPILFATLGLGFFLVPVLQKLRGTPDCDIRRGVKSPMWWAGLAFTVLAILMQGWLRIAAERG